MLTVNQYEFIRTAHRVYGKNISELSRMTGHSRNTVKKALRGEAWGYKERSHQPFPVLGHYLEIIDGWLKGDKEQPRKQRHTARRIYNRLVEECGYQGGESTVRRYVRMAKIMFGLGVPKAFVPGDPEAGCEAEVDWGSAKAIIAGETVRLKFFCMRSKYSGKHFVRFYPCERQQALFDAHKHAFEFFGGVFPVLIYDNMSTAVHKVLLGKNRVEQESFSKFKAYYSFDSRFCNPASGNEKGGVEGLVGFSRRNYMVPVPEAASLEELNEEILRRCVQYGQHKMAGREHTVETLYEMERQHLLSLPEQEFSNVQSSDGKVDKYATVIVDKNRYSVPSRFAGCKAKILLYVDRVELYVGGRKRAVHERLYGNNKWCLKPEHYLELIQQRPMSFNSARPIRQWRQSWPEALHRLLRRFCEAQGETKGIKDFISVLMLYDTYSADEIKAAAELALERHLSTSESVHHLLIYADERPRKVESLPNWSKLPAPDISIYGRLGGGAL